MSELIPRSTVTEIVAHRDEAIRLYDEFFDRLEDAHALLGLARQHVASACPGGKEVRDRYASGSAPEIEEFNAAVSVPNVDQHKRVARRLTDLQVWAAVIAHTELEVLMDRTAKDELRKQMAYVPERVDRETGALINGDEVARGLPPVTEDNIFATLDTFREQAGDIWKRGIASAFSKLDRRFRSHDGFKIGSRVILSGAFDGWGMWSHYSHHRDTILDIERVFLVLDGRKPTAAYAGIVGIMEAGRQGGHLQPRQSRHVGDYFEVRVFKNGNAHLWFRRPDLLEKVNQLLADYYGAGLGWGKAEREADPEAPFAGAMERAPARNFGLFPTPDALAERVIREAHLYSERPLAILEPSAGTGQLARRAALYESADYRNNYRESRPLGHQVTAVEIQPELAADLRREGIYSRVLCRDFLTMEPEPVFDRVVMNPPFDRDRDIDHVNHALGFLKTGGRLVAIMSASTEFQEGAKAEAFRAKVAKLKGRFQDLPEGSFREVGTNVNTALLVVQL